MAKKDLTAQNNEFAAWATQEKPKQPIQEVKQVKQNENVARLTIELSEALKLRIEMAAVKSRKKVGPMLRDILEREFPE
jgi:hypothetical protein